jgi:lipopolysaccharide transport system permease protein
VWTGWRVTHIVATRDIRIKYKQSFLGPIWLMLQPLGMLLGVTVAFAGITRVDTGGVPYLVFALVGITIWSYFQLTVSTAAPTLISNSTLVRRSACPRVALVNGALVANLPTLGLMTVLTIVLAAALNGPAIIPLVLQAGMFVSPVGYPISSASGALEVALSINPLSGLIEVWRWSILGTAPILLPVILAGVWMVILTAGGWWVFGRMETEFADYL